MIKVNGLSVSRIPINGKETLRIMKNGQQLWSGTALPSGYTALEFIESSGQQYIDTGISISPSNGRKLKYVIDSQMMGDLSAANINGSGWGATPYFNSFYVGFFQGIMYYGNGRSDQSVSGTIADSNRHIFTYDAKNGIASISGIKEIYFSYQNPDGALPLILFGYSQHNNTPLHSERMYSCKIYQDDIIIRDYIPCMNTQGVCGLFDKVNRVFYQSASSIPFTGDYFKEVEYIQFNGSQYLDTGFIPTNKSKVVYDTLLSSKKQWSGLYYPSGSWLMFGMNYDFEVYFGSKGLSTLPNPTERKTLIFDAINGIVIVNGSTAISGVSYIKGSQSMYIGAMQQSSGLSNYSDMKMYSCQIYDNNVLLRDYVPVKGMVTGTYGLYDKVNKVFYGSASSTPFTGA